MCTTSLTRRRSIRSAAAAGAHAQVSSWFTEVRDRTENDPPVIVLVGNKTDLAEHSAIKDEAVEQLARQLGGVQTFKCSAKDGSGVDEIFNALTEAIMRKVGSDHRD